MFNGDCLDVMPEIESGSIDMILADLPYGTTSCGWDVIIPFEPLWNQYKRICRKDGAIVLFSSQPFTTKLIQSNIDDFRYSLVWDKIRCAGFLNANRMPLKQHEDICVFYGKQPTYNPQKHKGKPYDKTKYNGNKQDENVIGSYVSESKKNKGDRYPKSILRFSQNWTRQNQIHPTQKPVDLFRYLIKTYSNKGDLVLDNVMGSGTCAIASHDESRDFIGIELDTDYFNDAVKRFENHISQGQLF